MFSPGRESKKILQVYHRSPLFLGIKVRIAYAIAVLQDAPDVSVENS